MAVLVAGRRFDVRRAFSVREVREALEELLAPYASLFRADARVVLKPNLNNDLCALTGNATDLRVLAALLEALADRGIRRVSVADGPNVGVERRRIDVFRRLRVDRLCERYGASAVDLNTDAGIPIELGSGARPRVARALVEADLRIGVPTVKTHVEAGLSAACKNWVGIVVAQDKREMHRDLVRTITALVEALPPHLVVVDGLVGMEGSGPGDGDPVRLGFVAASDDPWLCDLAVCKMVGLDWRRVPVLELANQRGRLTQGWVDATSALPVLAAMRPAPRQSPLMRLASSRRLLWVKKALRPVTDRPVVSRWAHRAGAIQDVYSVEDDTVRGLARDEARCGPCTRCVDFCPTGLPLERIGRSEMPDCIGCLYCWWVCPNDALDLDGELGGMRRQVERYKKQIENL